MTLHGLNKLGIVISKDGALWLHGVDGVIARYFEGEVHTHRYVAPGRLQR